MLFCPSWGSSLGDLDLLPPQALSVKDSEKAVLLEKLLATQQSLANITLELERQKRESRSCQEQERVGRLAGPGASPQGRAESLSANK